MTFLVLQCITLHLVIDLSTSPAPLLIGDLEYGVLQVFSPQFKWQYAQVLFSHFMIKVRFKKLIYITPLDEI